MDNRMTQRIRALAHELGVDLVGFANIERFAEAPIKMSPLGIMPSAKTVIVCAIHHPDATIELEGGEHGDSQVFESYSVQYTMNCKLDHISFTIAHFLDNNGYNAVPIVSSNIWRYRSYKELDAVFSPDMSHIYAAVCAGLSEMGWNGLSLTPEYGPRNRFVSIITDAELEPTPLLPGGTLCDRCGECIRYCPTDAYRKEVNGTKQLHIPDGKGGVITHTFANKNLWRCAWGEHFNLDLDLPIPEKVTEKEIVDRVREKGMRGGEFGVCLKVCVPKSIRFKDEAYSKYNRRVRYFADRSAPVTREVYDRMAAIGYTYHVDRITIVNADRITTRDLKEKLPNCHSAVFVTAKAPAMAPDTDESLRWQMGSPVGSALGFGLGYAQYDMAKEVEKMGYSVMPNMSSLNKLAAEFAPYELAEGESVAAAVWITDAPLEERDWFLAPAAEESKLPLREMLDGVVKEFGGDMTGVASAARIAAVADQLAPVKNGEQLLNARDKNSIFKEYDPVVTESGRRITRPEDYLKGAKSVYVIGMSYPGEAARSAGREPAEAVGPFIFAQSQVLNELAFVGLEAVKALRRAGYRAVMTRDLLGMGSLIGSPRGEYAAPFNGAIEAVAAGLGGLTYSGSLNTAKYGVNQRVICVVTDADLAEDAVLPNTVDSVCAACRKCLDACPMAAFENEKTVALDIGGVKYDYIPLNTVKCQWASRYVLTNKDGDDCLGSKLAIMPEGKITKEQLEAGLRHRDPITKFRPGNAEKCVTECPLTAAKA